VVTTADSVSGFNMGIAALADGRSCAGICELSKDPATGKFTRIRLKLSTPLLQYRPRFDTINHYLMDTLARR
jgi:hypothetical protein